MSGKTRSQKIIVVTGASSGIGKASAQELLAAGHTVVAAARRVGAMAELAQAGARVVQFDITNAADVIRLVDATRNEYGRIDALVNNAGYATFGSIEETSIEDARRQFEVNVFGLASVTRAVLPIMREKRSGRIVIIGSIGGRIYTPLGAWYHATKHALEGFADCLRLETRPFGIDVSLLQPGIISTEFADVMVPALLERSGRGPYADLAQAVARVTRKSYDPASGSSPCVVARVVRRAIEAKRPKTRYAMGKLAKPLLALRAMTCDRTFDALLMSQAR